MQELKGLGVAMVTPFNKDGSVDFAGLGNLVKHLHKGADFLVVMGTTGEAVTLNMDEQMKVLSHVVKVNEGRLPIVFGMGGNNTAELVREMENFKNEAVVAFLSASPAYNKPTQEGIYRHYKALNDASPLPIILYNVPGRTASNVLPHTVLRIARECSNIIAIKEAAGSIEQVMELSRILPEDFMLLSGDDALALPHMACGGHGIISVVGNAYPETFGKVIHDALEGNLEAARRNHYRLLPLIANLFREGNPGGIKETLKLMGICDHHMRLPLYPVSEGLRKELAANVNDLPEA